MQEKFASLSFDPLYLFAACAFLNFWPLCLSHSQKPGGAVLKLKLLKRTVIDVNIFSLERSNAAWERQISRYSHHRPWLLWSGLWMGFNSPSHWRSFDSHRDALTPGQREKRGLQSSLLINACLEFELFVFTEMRMCCSLMLFSHRLVLTAGKTSSTSQSISFRMDTAPSFPQRSRVGQNHLSPVMKV